MNYSITDTSRPVLLATIDAVLGPGAALRDARNIEKILPTPMGRAKQHILGFAKLGASDGSGKFAWTPAQLNASADTMDSVGVGSDKRGKCYVYPGFTGSTGSTGIIFYHIGKDDALVLLFVPLGAATPRIMARIVSSTSLGNNAYSYTCIIQIKGAGRLWVDDPDHPDAVTVYNTYEANNDASGVEGNGETVTTGTAIPPVGNNSGKTIVEIWSDTDCNGDQVWEMSEPNPFVCSP